jgi:hypothetical protein
MRLSGFVFVLVALAVVLSPARAHADGDERARFNGSFRYAGSTGEEAARRAAIDRAIDSLFFAIRGIARSRLSNGTKIDPWVSFSLAASKIRVRIPLSPEAVSPDDGAAVDYVNDGERSKLSQRIAGSKITQVFAADEGKRMNEWVLSPDGATLVLNVTISSPKLTRPVVYSLTYKRSP